MSFTLSIRTTGSRRWLFMKEYRKACRMLKINEAKALRRWLAAEGYRQLLKDEPVAAPEGHVVSLPREVSRATSESDLPKAS